MTIRTGKEALNELRTLYRQWEREEAEAIAVIEAVGRYFRALRTQATEGGSNEGR